MSFYLKYYDTVNFIVENQIIDEEWKTFYEI